MSLSNKALPRLEYIESKLFWEGRVHRKDLVRDLGISEPQATLDLKAYREAYPNNIQYTGGRYYIPTINFMPKLITPNPHEYLQSTQSIEPALPVCRVSIFNERLDVDVVRDVVRAMRDKAKLHIEYQGDFCSFGQVVVPLLFVFDGMRWNVRAFCCETGHSGFEMLSLSRISETENTGTFEDEIPKDKRWENIIEVVLAPNTRLFSARAATICEEFGIVEKKTVFVRESVLPFFLLANRLYPLDNKGSLIVENADEIQTQLDQANIDIFR